MAWEKAELMLDFGFQISDFRFGSNHISIFNIRCSEFFLFDIRYSIFDIHYLNHLMIPGSSILK
ncbi:hypothetical protein D0X99_18585 [Algoriphagus lacus]|uniref:Uncharacterized protein n=1 Tax=Algoriphagus lacus TaxID=2056311 RepID=A0A418PMR2_9BACT|nr:hypothetical protein D0X99_18585 [Algoriphagus lacus]